MELQDYIREHGFEKTCADFKLLHRVHNKYPNLYLLSYNQIESDFSRIETRQARGIILDRDNKWNIVSRSYDKFFNIREKLAPVIDWNTARVYEKLDGSLCVLYWYDGEWQVQTSGSPEASGEVNDWCFSFKDLFWETWNKLGYELPPVEDSRTCFIFELMTPFNKIVITHQESRIVLHGARSIDGEEYSANNRNWRGWEEVTRFPFSSLEEVINTTRDMNGLNQEGYVVCDAAFNRVKIKCTSYLRYAHLKDSLSASNKNMIDLIRNGESSEFLVYFPEFTDRYNSTHAIYTRIVDNLTSIYEEWKHLADMKAFALKVKDYPGSGALFALKRGQVTSVKDWLAQIPLDSAVDLINYYRT